ncbi:MAG: metallophosphoesterase family protein [Planctomycetota bacterium]
MRTFVIGDIHGHLTALQQVSKAANLRYDDLLITLGDYVDRGPDSKGVLDWIVQRSTSGKVIPLLGNHEQMMLAAHSDHDPDASELWMLNGGRMTLSSYGTNRKRGSIEDVPKQHWEFLERKCRLIYQTEQHFFVHGGIDPERGLEEQTELSLLWTRFDDAVPHPSGKIMICGHTPQASGKPRDLGYAICLDTCVFGGGWLTCLDLESKCYWQSDSRGEVRRGRLRTGSTSHGTGVKKVQRRDTRSDVWRRSTGQLFLDTSPLGFPTAAETPRY